jgi:hypothetical protein
VSFLLTLFLFLDYSWNESNIPLHHSWRSSAHLLISSIVFNLPRNFGTVHILAVAICCKYRRLQEKKSNLTRISLASASSTAVSSSSFIDCGDCLPPVSSSRRSPTRTCCRSWEESSQCTLQSLSHGLLSILQLRYNTDKVSVQINTWWCVKQESQESSCSASFLAGLVCFCWSELCCRS